MFFRLYALHRSIKSDGPIDVGVSFFLPVIWMRSENDEESIGRFVGLDLININPVQATPGFTYNPL